MANEPMVRRARIPTGYAFVPKGNVYLTGSCRKQTQATSQPVYLVVNGSEKQIGIAVPIAIHQDVQQKELETRAARASNVDRRDNSIKNGFEKVVLEEFPRLPREELPKILDKALEKGAGKVGRTGQLEDRKKAQLAVRAHIRHCHTHYDRILKGPRVGSSGKNMARRMVQAQVDGLAATWGPDKRRTQPSQPPQPRLTTKTPLIVKRKSSPVSSRAASRAATAPAAQTPVSRAEKASQQLAVRSQRVRKKRLGRVLPAASTKKNPTTCGATMTPRASEEEKLVPRQVEVIDLTMDDDD
ncbi:unnamed protein product [Discula destructiva]